MPDPRAALHTSSSCCARFAYSRACPTLQGRAEPTDLARHEVSSGREKPAPMTNAQLYLAIGVPALLNAIMFGLLMAYINAKFEGVNQRFESVNQRFEGINQRFEGINQRFDDMRDLWRTELRRVEDVLDARLKHLEEAHE